MAFPTTSILDDFNRADSPTSLGASWSTGGNGSGWTSCGILTNKLYATGAFNANYWATTFASDQEVFAKITTMPVTGSVRLWIRMQSPGVDPTSCYQLQVLSTGAADVYKYVSGTGTYLFSGSGTVVANDIVGLSTSGALISLYRNGVLEGSTSDSSVSGTGSIGIGFPDDTAVRVDDFGGGATVAGTPPTPRTTFSPQRW